MVVNYQKDRNLYLSVAQQPTIITIMLLEGQELIAYQKHRNLSVTSIYLSTIAGAQEHVSYQEQSFKISIETTSTA